jgi:hypothetical protein
VKSSVVIVYIELVSRKCLEMGLSCKSGDSLVSEAVTRRQEVCQNGRRYVTVSVSSVLTTPEIRRTGMTRTKRFINARNISHIKNKYRDCVMFCNVCVCVCVFVILTFSVFCLCTYLYCFVVILLFYVLCFVVFFVVMVVLCIFISVCTSVGLLPPGESPIAVSNNNNNNKIIINMNLIVAQLTKNLPTFC